MATIQNPGIVRDLMRLRGVEDGFQWSLIYQYQNLSGETLFALYSDPRHCDIYQSPYVRNPVLFMENGYITDEGAVFLGIGKDDFNDQTEQVDMFDNDIGGVRDDAYALPESDNYIYIGNSQSSTRIDSLSDATREFLDMGVTATQLANFTGQSLEFQKEFVIKIGGNPVMFEVTRQQGDHPIVALRKALLVG